MFTLSRQFTYGDISCAKNYRPISLLCCIPLFFEKIIHSKIADFVSKSIITCQFRLLKIILQHNSCFISSVKFLRTLRKISHVDIIYLDYRASNSLPNQEIPYKLWTGTTGICGCGLGHTLAHGSKWLESTDNISI